MLRIAVVGGGPAGLLFAKLAKQKNSEHQIDVFEQNPATATYGFGEHIALKGNRFMGISRVKLLEAMQRNAIDQGVQLHFEKRVNTPAILDDYDLVVGADGVNSVLRTSLNAYFQATKEARLNKWVWYATPKRFSSVGLIFQETPFGTFIAHSYRFSPDMGTFVIECSEDSWRKAGLDRATDEQSRHICEGLFEDYLEGAPLVSNRSPWFNPEFVTSKNWRYRNAVLIGDALKTVHPSIGSGTRVAMQDAIALAKAISECGDDISAAFDLFERERRSGAAAFQDAAMKSILWYETVDERMDLDPIAFAYDFMMRTGRVSNERLRRVDPEFADLVAKRFGHLANGVN
jgi:anthraniloyl-CoA monooxygenase